MERPLVEMALNEVNVAAPCMVGISPAMCRAQNPQKSLLRGVWDPPTLNPQKVPEKSESLSARNSLINFVRRCLLN